MSKSELFRLKIQRGEVINTCKNCKWSYIGWAKAYPESFPMHHLRCNPGGDSECDQVADVPCLRWKFDDGDGFES